MTLLIVLAALNLVVGGLVLYAVLRPKPPIVFHAPANRGATPPTEHTPTLPRYSVVHGSEVLYDGHDSDAAVAAWQQMERAPDEHPSAGYFYENGRNRAHRPAHGKEGTS